MAGASPEKRDFARKLRRHMTPCERILWERLRRDRLGVRFRRQHVIEGWIADFYCPSRKLVVEVDGASHWDRQRQDAVRDHVLGKHGFRTLRLTNEEVATDLDAAVARIRAMLA